MIKSGKSQRVVQTVGPYDILCGRCKKAYHNVGNRRFRVTMNINLDAYMNARCKMERSILIASIVNHLIEDAGAKFLKPQKGGDGGYIELDEAQAREKVGHALRDMSFAKTRITVTERSKKAQNESKQQSKLGYSSDKESGDVGPVVVSNVASGSMIKWQPELRQDVQQDCIIQQKDDYILQWQRNKLKAMLAEGRNHTVGTVVGFANNCQSPPRPVMLRRVTPPAVIDIGILEPKPISVGSSFLNFECI